MNLKKVFVLCLCLFAFFLSFAQNYKVNNKGLYYYSARDLLEDSTERNKIYTFCKANSIRYLALGGLNDYVFLNQNSSPKLKNLKRFY
jgi:hypothetical protein